MFKSLDTLVAFSTIMLMLSMAVTVITQAITGVFNSRGRHLKRGLEDLLRLLDPDLPPDMSVAVANAVLTHHLISGSSWLSSAGMGGKLRMLATAIRWVFGPRLGTVILREEFTKVLMHFASADGAKDVTPEISKRLKLVLAANGIADPGRTLSSIRLRALEIERLQPALGTAVRQSTAVLREAASEYVAKINGTFDQTMDRVSQRFTASTRAVTLVGALIVAVTFQVDALMIVNRLSADDQMRAAFVAKGIEVYTQPESSAGQPPGNEGDTQPSGNASATKPSGPTPEQFNAQYRSFLAAHGIISLPSRGEWSKRWSSVNPFGVALTVLLLSLGAPFWYKALGQLLNLRSLLAAKDDSHRAARQGRPPASAAAPAAGDNRGDPAALG